MLSNNEMNYLEERVWGRKTILNSYYSRCGQQTSSVDVTWEEVKNADSET